MMPQKIIFLILFYLLMLSNFAFSQSEAKTPSQQSVVVAAQTEIKHDSTQIVESLKSISEKNDSTIVRLELTGGSVLIGTIISEDSTSITLNLLSNNETTIAKEMIIDREIVSSNIKNGQYWFDDPNNTRLLFAPTARGLKSGTGYISVYELFFPMVAIGLNDYVTIAGGLSVFPGSIGDVLYFAPKITPYQSETVSLSIGDFFVKPNEGTEYLNIAYGIGTFSFGRGAITAGVGYETNSKQPIILIGGELRISRYAKLITENWFIANSDFNFVSFGIRFLGKRLAADFALIFPLIDEDDFIFMPWIGFAYNF